jgi:hypothetical protein
MPNRNLNYGRNGWATLVHADTHPHLKGVHVNPSGLVAVAQKIPGGWRTIAVEPDGRVLTVHGRTRKESWDRFREAQAMEAAV